MANLSPHAPRAPRVRQSTAQRCTETWLDPHGAYRCRMSRFHPGACHCGASGDGVCMRRQTNHTTRLMRFCALPSAHDGACVYLRLTERAATYEEMGVPTHDGEARMIVILPRDIVIME